MTTSNFVDSNSTECKVTQCSHTGTILFANKVPIQSYLKHQNINFWIGVLCKKNSDWYYWWNALLQAWMLGILLAHPTSVFCENELVVNNSSAPESNLKMSQCNCLSQSQWGIRHCFFSLLGREVGNRLVTCFQIYHIRALISFVMWLIGGNKQWNPLDLRWIKQPELEPTPLFLFQEMTTVRMTVTFAEMGFMLCVSLASLH